MGCNTSSDMKTKDGVTAAEENEQNGKIVEEQQPAAGGDDGVGKKAHAALSNGEAAKLQNGVVPDKADISELDDMELGEDEAKAATKIQAVFRGHQVRSTIKKSDETVEQEEHQKTTTTTIMTTSTTTKGNGINSSTTTKEITTIKNGPSTEAAANEAPPTREELEAEFDPNDKELCDAALKIQSAFRGHMTRKTVSTKDDEEIDLKEITKKVAEELDIDLNDPELNKAATKIQASFRGHKTRKEVTAQ